MASYGNVIPNSGLIENHLAQVDTIESALPDTASLVEVEGLSIAYGHQQVVTDISFSIPRGKTVALIGESGSGKSTIARALLRLLPSKGRAKGRIHFDGKELLHLKEREYLSLRGRDIGFIPQDPGNSLNPVRTIGKQAHEAARLIEKQSVLKQKQRILESFEQVGLPHPEQVYTAYPHELSGGMLQRVLIALAILPRPSLIVADEPTSALDVTIQKRILDLLTRLQHELDISLLLITHDLAVAAERADRLVVLKQGRIEEKGPTGAVFDTPASDYAKRLRNDAPSLSPERFKQLRETGLIRLRNAESQPPLVEISTISKRFGQGAGSTQAVIDTSINVTAGTTHALVGESGSGKTTTARMLLGLEQPDSGDIRIGGESITGRAHGSLRELRRHLQLVYQNPFTSLNPTWTIEKLVREPLDHYRIGATSERSQRVIDALENVGLSEQFRRRKPRALSGGQRQRVAIARALVLEPDIIVLDEPTSALDVSVQAEIVRTLLELQVNLGLTYVFVSHDLALVRQLAHSVSVMKQGRIVEQGLIDEVFVNPSEDYTKALLAAIPGHQLEDSSPMDTIAEAPRSLRHC